MTESKSERYAVSVQFGLLHDFKNFWGKILTWDEAMWLHWL